MPYIQTKTNVSLTKELETELKSDFAKAIELIPGKSEKWLMLSFSDNQRMWFAGDNSPMAMLEVKIFGSAADTAYDALSDELTDIVSSKLGIEPTRIYIKYEETTHWGWNGSNF